MTGTDLDDIPSYPCPVCRTLCHPFEGIFVDGRWYHERCYVYYLGETIDKLQKKVKRGSITLEEAEELRSLDPVYKKLRVQKNEWDIRKQKEPPKFIGNTKIALLSVMRPSQKHVKKIQTQEENKLLISGDENNGKKNQQKEQI